MPPRDSIHNLVKQAIIKDGWKITDDPYVISYGDRFLFIDQYRSVKPKNLGRDAKFRVSTKISTKNP